MTRRRVTAAWMLGLLAAIVPIAIQVDRWMIERRQMRARMHFEIEVAECEAGGGEWWRGECRRSAP